MSYTFKKTVDLDNRFDNANVIFELPSNEQTVDDLLEVFADFLKGCGFSIGTLVHETEEETESLDE